MKKVKIYELTTTRNNDAFTVYDFDLKILENRAYRDLMHLTYQKAKKLESAYIATYEVNVPDSYELTTADNLMVDLLIENVSCPEYDDCTGGFKDLAQTEYRDLKVKFAEGRR